MRFPARLILVLAAALLAVPALAAPEPATSMVRISTTSQQPDYSVPWSPGGVVRGVGAGFVIEGNTS